MAEKHTHTPGPWKTLRDGDDIVILGRPTWPCEWLDHRNRWSVAVVDDLCGEHQKERRANAHLIAAAPAMLVALEAAFEMAWEDTREVRFDDSIVMGKGYDFFGWENLRQEIHTGHGSWAVWPNSDFRGPNWSVYGGPDGSLWFEKFDTERAAKECAAKAIERLGSAHPIVAIRAAIAQAKGE